MRITTSLLLLAISLTTHAEDASTFKAQVNLVTLLATVRDHNGGIVKALAPDDFILEEDGVPQTIRYFSRESDLPLTIGLLIDTSRSQSGVLNEESKASSVFLSQVLREDKDEAFIAHFDTHVETLQGLTSSRSELASALNRLSIPDEVATLLFSAVKDASLTEMKQQQGRKALIVLTDGVAYKDPISMGNAIEAAQRADTILYAIRFSDPIEAYRPVRAAFLGAMKERGKSDLEHMARVTGGASYGVNKNETIGAIFAEIEDTLRNQYSIGYTPSRSSPDGKYHTIKLLTKDHRLVVETREGYFAK